MDKTKALSKCMQLCSRKEYCISDIYQKLNTWEVMPNVADEIIDVLISEKFLDETRYVKAYINDKFKFNKWGRTKIKYLLKQKSIPPDLISEGLKEIDSNVYLEVIQQLILEKKRKVKSSSEFEINGKVANYLASRGFEANLVFKYLNSDFDE